MDWESQLCCRVSAFAEAEIALRVDPAARTTMGPGSSGSAIQISLMNA
jgi:hypothetical protein